MKSTKENTPPQPNPLKRHLSAEVLKRKSVPFLILYIYDLLLLSLCVGVCAPTHVNLRGTFYNN